VSYQPDDQCPLFKQTLREIAAQSDEMVRHLQEVLGYWIQPIRDLKKFFILYGGTNSSKSSLVEFVAQTLVGEDGFVSMAIDGQVRFIV
jgi:phage/plasmid-associated DNA primase